MPASAAQSSSSAVSLGPMPATARMRTVDQRIVRVPLDVIFDVAADVERWPAHLAHYRYVRFREGDGRGGIVEMSANRPFGAFNWPTWWLSLMEVQRHGDAPPAIRFRHIGGITRRMEVEWSFEPVTQGTLVTILHLWNGPAWPVISSIAARAVIGPVFVHGIASRTLEGLARAAERRQTSAPQSSREQ
jgi:ribosome-associated toxin RatA of RatAB toxin-antitoxin module